MSATTAATVERLSTRELDRKAASSLAWQIGKVAVQLVQYVLLARLVSPAEFGIFLLAIPLYTVLAAINDGGLSDHGLMLPAVKRPVDVSNSQQGHDVNFRH